VAEGWVNGDGARAADRGDVCGVRRYLVADFDVVEFLHRVAERCVELLDCAESGVLIADPAGALRAMASSSERTEALELLQAQNDEGPCFECYHDERPVLSEDLTADANRWPTFAPAAVRAGFASVHAVPMRAHGQTIGALNLFRSGTGRLAAADVPVSQGMADIAAIGLLNERQARESHDTVSQLQRALQSRVGSSRPRVCWPSACRSAWMRRSRGCAAMPTVIAGVSARSQTS
jgi:GAF domain-containing protein